MAHEVSEYQRKSIATVYAKRSANERAKLRRFSAERVFASFFSGPESVASLAEWGFIGHLHTRHPYGGTLRLTRCGKHVDIPYSFIGVDGTRLIPYAGVAFIDPVNELLGFDRAHWQEVNTLWHFEIKDRSVHDARFLSLSKLLKVSIADVHLLHDGSYCRAYMLRDIPMVEFREPKDNHVTVTSLDHYLKLKGGG